jgi:hypothetical protein
VVRVLSESVPRKTRPACPSLIHPSIFPSSPRLRSTPGCHGAFTGTVEKWGVRSVHNPAAVFGSVCCVAAESQGLGRAYLDEANVGRLLAEALTADVEAVLADQTGLVGADAAVSKRKKNVSISVSLSRSLSAVFLFPTPRSKFCCNPPGVGLGDVLPGAGALAVGARARVPDGFVSHFDCGLCVLGKQGIVLELAELGLASWKAVGRCRDGRPKFQSCKGTSKLAETFLCGSREGLPVGG